MSITNYVASGLRGMVAAAFLSCAGPALATRAYEGADRKEKAYLNMRDILVELCCEGVGESYPNCRSFRMSEQGFHCVQRIAKDTGVITQVSEFRWDEIEQIECLGRIIKIKGKYDSSTIYTHGPVWKDSLPQCHDLEKAMRIYLEERKK